MHPVLLPCCALLVAAFLPHRTPTMPPSDPPSPGAPAARAQKGGDTAAETLGRRILSTAFVRAGPDGVLTIELRDGRVLVLRDVTMEPRGYCGRPVTAAAGGKRHCGGYAAVAAARPGNDVRVR